MWLNIGSEKNVAASQRHYLHPAPEGLKKEAHRKIQYSKLRMAAVLVMPMWVGIF